MSSERETRAGESASTRTTRYRERAGDRAPDPSGTVRRRRKPAEEEGAEADEAGEAEATDAPDEASSGGPASAGEGSGNAAPDVVERDPSERAVPTGPVEVVDDEDFESLLAESEERGADVPQLRPGDEVTGVVEVVSRQGSEVFLDLGSKATGYVLREELEAEDGSLTVSQGDSVTGRVVGTDAHGVRIRTGVSRDERDLEAIQQAYEAGFPVEGRVRATNKGGFEVEVAGARGFCPMSRIDLHRPEDPEQLVGRTYQFRIIELREGDQPVLSRTELLREQRREQAEEVRKQLRAGRRMTGVVRSIRPFGAFVDLGGVDGLIRTAELAWTKIDDPHEVVSLGDEVEVEVLEVDEDRDRIALSLRRTQRDPFEDAVEEVQVGDTVEGEVTRLTSFGAFVRVAEHVDGLVHVSDMAHYHVRFPSEVLSVGDTVRVKVTGIDMERRRIGLSLKALAEDPWEKVASRYPPGTHVTGRITKTADFGVFVEVEQGVTALIPASHSNVDPGTSVQGAFKVGRDIEARVLRVEPEQRRMALTLLSEEELEAQQGSGGARSRGKGGPAWSDDAPADRDEGGEEVGALGQALLDAMKRRGGDE